MRLWFSSRTLRIRHAQSQLDRLPPVRLVFSAPILKRLQWAKLSRQQHRIELAWSRRQQLRVYRFGPVLTRLANVKHPYKLHSVKIFGDAEQLMFHDCSEVGRAMLGEVFQLTTAGLLTAATAPTVRLDCLNAFRIMMRRR